VEGVNSSGSSMIAKRIIEGAPRARPSTSPSKLLDFHHSDLYQKGKPLRVFTAAGPFTSSQNLDYAPFNDLMGKVFNERPDVLILLGPFVDIAHPLLKDGDITLNDLDDPLNAQSASYEMVFITRIMTEGLRALFQSEDEDYAINTHIILIPSLADAHHEFVFPQPPFADRQLEKIENPFFEEAFGQLDVPYSKEGDPLKRVHLMPNPCMFRWVLLVLNNFNDHPNCLLLILCSVNEVLFGATSFDAILALSAEEIAQNSMNRIERLAAHLLQQQSFAPMFPAPANCLSQVLTVFYSFNHILRMLYLYSLIKASTSNG
jgi:DNA polymerase alpha subunit B